VACENPTASLTGEVRRGGAGNRLVLRSRAQFTVRFCSPGEVPDALQVNPSTITVERNSVPPNPPNQPFGTPQAALRAAAVLVILPKFL
jgi:hypothetical protein